MRSTTPKVLHSIGGRTLLAHVLAAVAAVDPQQTCVVVRHGRDEVAAAASELAPDATIVVQAEPRGTGHAARLALESLRDVSGPVLVVAGDTPLLTADTLRALLDEHRRTAAAATILSGTPDDPRGYGRVVRDAAGAPVGIVEHNDATPEQLAIAEVGTSGYLFDAEALRTELAALTTDNAQGEEYLTDVIGLLAAHGATIAAVRAPQWTEVAGVNDRVQLAAAARALRDRTVATAQLAGVTINDPATTWIDVGVELAADAVVEPFTMLQGTTSVGPGAVIGPYSRLTDTTVAAGARVVASTCVGAEVGPDASVGPYSYLRRGTRLGARAKVGGFVEVKNADVGDGSKVPHLSYVGDATIGTDSNVGAGTITCNYDGADKHRTDIGNDVFVGSGTMLVAPVTVGDGAYVAAGSTITSDVPADALGVSRARQETKEGWAARRRRLRPTAEERESGGTEQ
ncbi:MAG: bifunctional UDP-N-acetylglucosamine diphosphorylase/glucosamine-1-phosphate N-acetyltransferase GlmU [Mycobacteriales bacterium]